MSDRTFIDTNVILYSKDARDERKQSIADELVSRGIREGTLVVSAQVLNEFYVNATQKLTQGMNRENARTVCRSIAAVSCEPVTNETISAAWDIQDRFALSWWDSLIVASALGARCTRLLTEDLQDGLQVDGLQVVNPFA
jgi:predicted nucleic acid-binding protein